MKAFIYIFARFVLIDCVIITDIAFGIIWNT